MVDIHLYFGILYPNNSLSSVHNGVLASQVHIHSWISYSMSYSTYLVFIWMKVKEGHKTSYRRSNMYLVYTVDGPVHNGCHENQAHMYSCNFDSHLDCDKYRYFDMVGINHIFQLNDYS